MRRHIYCVAGFNFLLIAPDYWDMEVLLPSFRPFRSYKTDNDVLFSVMMTVDPFNRLNDTPIKLIDKTNNDFGSVSLYQYNHDYMINIHFGNEEYTHTMIVDSGFSKATSYVCEADPHLTTALSSMLHILFSQAILPYGAIAIHASAVSLDGMGYLFLGKSGTGKSTHSQLWIKKYCNCKLLNDDNPTIKVIGDKVVVYGTPWSGKTACYKNEYVPVKGIVRLFQSPINKFIPVCDAEAFAILLPSCSAIYSDKRLTDCLYDTVISVCETIRMGSLECRPDMEAATICHNELNTNSII